jgi:hypothetical protein
MSYLWKVLRFLWLCLIAPIIVCFLALIILPQFVIQLIRWPFRVHAQQLLRKERRIELQHSGRLISWVEFQSHAEFGKGIAIRDFEGCLWWDKEIPEPVVQFMMRTEKSRRIVRFYELQVEARDEIVHITESKDAHLVDLPSSKMPYKQWQKLGDENKIAMLSFQFKN